MTGLPWLRVAGQHIVTQADEPVLLRGVGVGGWLNMENFITGYPSTESLQRAAMRQAMGEEAYQAFFRQFTESFFGDADARYLASLGANCVRVPVNYRLLADDAEPLRVRDSGLSWLDRAVGTCAAHGLYTVLDLHALPGGQNAHWHSDNPTHRAGFWEQRDFQDRVVALWEAIARHFSGNPAVAGYNPINEPADPTGAVIGPVYARLASAIREVDPRHILFLDGNRYGTDFSALGDVLPNTVYAVHDYALPGIAAGSAYPGTTRGRWFDRQVVEQTFLDRTEFMRQTGTPVWVGEFGPVYTGDRAQDEMRYALLRDQLQIYREHGASCPCGLTRTSVCKASSRYRQAARTCSASLPCWRRSAASAPTPGAVTTAEYGTSSRRSSSFSPRSSPASTRIRGEHGRGSPGSSGRYCSASRWPKSSGAASPA